MKLKIGSVITITGSNKRYVLIDYVDHNANDYGACCNDETYYLFEYDEFKSYINNNEIITYDDLISKCFEYNYHDTRSIVFTVFDDIPPFEINIVKVAQIREKKKKIIQEIVWE